MNIYRNLNWARNTHRTPKEQLDLFNFNLSDHEDDVFYQNINEIDSIFVDEMSRSNIDTINDPPPDEDNDDGVIIDPRTDKVVEQLLKDHTLHNITTNRIEIKYFDKFPRHSTISKKNHQACIRAINLLHSANPDITEADQKDVQVYQNLESFRLEEKVQFRTFVQNHFNTYLVSRFSTVDEQFKDFLLKYEKHKINQWGNFYGSKQYILQTSLPNTAPTINDAVEMKFVKVVHKIGIVPFKLTVNKPNQINCAKNSKYNFMYLDPKSIKLQLIERDSNVPKIISELNESVDFVVNISSLIYLMDSTLKSWNIQVNIQDTENGSCVFIGKCLPRSDLNTIDLIKRGFKLALKYSTLNYHNKAAWNLGEDRVCGTEMKLDYQSTPPWKVQTFEDYLENLKFPARVFKPNHIYSLWNLTDEKLKFASKVLIRSKYDAREHYETGYNLMNLSTKVEFQSEFGAEIMTRTELIKEWLKQYINVDTVTKRIRIDSETGTIMSQKILNLTQIENDLMRLYKLDPKTLLNNLITKLDLISKKFPSGEYLLQYNADLFPHVKIYKLHSANLADSNVKLLKINDYLAGINLYNLNNTFIQYPNPNQIDDMEITLVHRHAGITPCAFLYADSTAPKSKNKSKKTKPAVIVDEKKRFNEKRQEMQKLQETRKKTLKNRKKKLKRELRFQRNAESLRLLNETKAREAREQRQFEYEYNICGMFDEHGNVRVNTIPTESLPPLNTTQSYTYESSPKKLQKKCFTPQSTQPPNLPAYQDINKTNYSILNLPPSSSSTPSPSSSSSTLCTDVSTVESGDDIKIVKIENHCNKRNSNTNANNKQIGKQSLGNSVLGSLRKSLRMHTNKRRYF